MSDQKKSNSNPNQGNSKPPKVNPNPIPIDPKRTILQSSKITESDNMTQIIKGKTKGNG